MIDIIAYHRLGMLVPVRFVLITIGILGVGFQMQEVGANRTISVLESAQHDTVFHLGHLCANHDR